ncbi:MAG: hypothetical protein HFE78_01450 [Clostridiales bacterium]|nr:hypothetical protein [Clostridiales bacterium]
MKNCHSLFRHSCKRKTSALLFALAIISTSILPPLRSHATAGGLGHEFASREYTLCDGLTYQEIHAENSAGYQIGYAFTMTPNEDAALSLGYGKTLYGRKTLSEIIETAENAGQNVVGALNADRFSVQSGLAYSAMISDNEILATNDTGAVCLGMKKNGQAFIGIPNIRVTVQAGTVKLPVVSLNKLPEEQKGAVLVSSVFADSTKSSHASIEILIKPSSASQKWISGQPITGTITSVQKNVSDTTIPSGYYALSIPVSHADAAAYAALKPNTSLTITVNADGEWADANFAVGASAQILKDGAVQTEAVNTTRGKTAAARSCVGITGNGKIVFFAADGDGKNGHGITLNEAAAEMRALGCENALELDSYTSTTAALKEPGAEHCTIVNHPAAGQERAISAGILLINKSRLEEPYALKIEPSNPYVMVKGGSIKLSCTAVSRSGTALSEPLTDVQYTLSNPLGSLSGSIYTSGAETGSAVITATAKVKNKIITGRTTLQVINAVDDIVCENTNIVIPAGGYENLNIIGYRSSIPVTMCAAKMTWSFTGAAMGGADDIINDEPGANVIARCQYGYLDNALVFHATENAAGASFTLNAKYGYKTISLHITIGKPPHVITAFDNRLEMFSSYLNFNEYYTYRYAEGKRHTSALQFSGYNVSYKKPVWLGNHVSSVKVWIKGDAVAPYITLIDEYGTEASVYYQKEKDYQAYNGWILYTAAIPKELKGDIAIKSPVCSLSPYRLDCIIDEITAYYDLAGEYYCDTAKNWAKTYIDMMYEMDIASGSLVNEKRYYYPEDSLTRAEFAKFIVSYYKIDATEYQNYELTFRDYYDIPSWSKNYIRAAVANGLMSGSSNPDGSVDFLPNDKITRAQIFSVIGRKINAPAKELPFTDKEDIPSWALPTLMKIYGAGLVAGYPDGSLKPNAPVTRAEAAVMLHSLYRYEYQ